MKQHFMIDSKGISAVELIISNKYMLILFKKEFILLLYVFWNKNAC